MSALTPEAWAQIRHAYEHTDRPIGDICAAHGISDGTLRLRVRRWQWKRRRPPIDSDGPPPRPASRVARVTPQPSAAPLVAAMPASVPGASPGEDAAHCLPAAGPAAFAEEDGITGDSDAGAIAPRLQHAVARVIPAVEATLAKLAGAPVHAREMESAARTLGSLTRTLRALNALLAEQPRPEEKPRDIEELRRGLVQKLEAIIAERDPAGMPGPEPERALTAYEREGLPSPHLREA